MSATLSLLGLYEFDDKLFDGFNYPAEFTPDERKTLIDNLILDTAELELLYPDAHFMAIAIRAWTKKELPVWEKLLATTNLDYNPIWNKDGTITETITGKHKTDGSEGTTRKDSYTDTGSGESADSGQRAGTVNNGTNHKVSGYNMASGTATDWEQSDSGSSSESQSSSQTQSSTLQHNAEGSDTHTSTESGSTEQTLTRKEQGNIGVTTTQDMIKAERDIDQFNIMDYIIDSFKKRFCLLVY